MTLLLTSSSSLDWVICTAHIISAASKRRRRPKLFSLLLRSTFSDFPNSVDGSSISSHSNSDFRCSVNGIKNRQVRAVLFSLFSSSPTFPKVENTNAERHPAVPAPLPQRLLYLALPASIMAAEGNSKRLPATTAASWTELPIRILTLNTLMQDLWYLAALTTIELQ